VTLVRAMWLQYYDAAAQIREHAPTELSLDLVLVKCSEMNEVLIDTTAMLVKTVLGYVERWAV
jgi:hypothetical protein